MSLSPNYFKYLKHFGKTVTLREFSENRHLPDLIALRHDVDYDLDLALEMSYWEHQKGIRSSYYLLHTSNYWEEPRFLEKCLQIQDFGHEVGLHLNVLTEWFRGEIRDIEKHIEQLIIPLRETGLKISGVSSHGDRLCYEHNFINYWCLAELKPSNPILESGLSAEGIPVKEKQFQIEYPDLEELVRLDGERLNLWSVSMSNLEINYEAIHVPHDFYYTDSGGQWSRSSDPLQSCLKFGRHQILIHPVYWRGEKKIYFFLSTARSGSKWLTNFLEKATPLKANHEFTLNHRFEKGQLITEKRTADGFTELVANEDEANKLCRESRTWIEEFPEDYGEANVYLERFSQVMTEVFPDATLIHLYRNPKNVIRSLINRDWYDTPQDNRHPIMNVQDWHHLSQLEKACWYVRQTNESLLSLCQDHLIFERMVSDCDYLTAKLRSWQIPVFPRLAKLEFLQKLNVNYSYEFPEYEEWLGAHKSLFHSICDPLMIVLGYKTLSNNRFQLFSYLTSWYIRLVSIQRKIEVKIQKLFKSNSKQQILQIDFSKDLYQSYSTVGCQLKKNNNGIDISPEGDRNLYFLFGGGQWHRVEEPNGWQSQIAHYYQGIVDLEVRGKATVQLFALMYDDNGKLIAKRSLGLIKQDVRFFKFAFKPKSNVKRFNLALYISALNLPEKVQLKKFRLEMVSL